MWGILLWICFMLTAITGIFISVGECDWVGLCQIVLVYFAVLFLEEKINQKK
jgi:hypothetical protein